MNPFEPAQGRTGEPFFRLDSIEKSFAGLRALSGINLQLVPGEVLGLIGENGAGKSTLIKILSGMFAPDRGTITWCGCQRRFQSPREAIDAGIATIYQEMAYFPRLSVAENILLGEKWPRRRWGGIDWNALHAEARERLSRFELDIPTSSPFNRLSSAQKQEVAIARALSQKSRLLILDEPTASLSEPEVQRLFAHLNRLRQENVAMIYVSHRLDEILGLTDRVLVLRDGEMIASYPTREADIGRMVRDMIGRPLSAAYPHRRSNGLGPPLLEVDLITRKDMFRNITFDVRAGEIVGLAGLVGAGCVEVGRAIYGLCSIDSGRMHLSGRKWNPLTPRDSLAAGLVYLPEERKHQGLVMEHSVADSISIGFNDLLARWGIIPHSQEQQRVQQCIDKFRIQAASIAQNIGALSGGNQQKALLARWIDRDPKILVLNEPTRGVDVGAKAEIHALMDRLAGKGKAILLISSDLPEVLGMSNRVLVMDRGTLSAELSGEQMTQANVILAASGFYSPSKLGRTSLEE